MYIPAVNREENLPALHEMMRAYSFATLVTRAGESSFATHLPLLLDETRGPLGTLRGHVARANPQWRSLVGQPEVLVLFQGPHTYISPAWYEVRPSVPTWNYVAVHAYGAPQLVEDRSTLRRILEDLTAVYEGGRADPWRIDLPEEMLGKLMDGIVGFEIEIARLEGKKKLSQNRSAGDQEGVIAALIDSGDPAAADVARLMAEIRKTER